MNFGAASDLWNGRVGLLHVAYGGMGGHVAVVNGLNEYLAGFGIFSATLGITRSAAEQAHPGQWIATEYVPVTSSHPLRGRRERKHLRDRMLGFSPRIILAHTHGLVPELWWMGRGAKPKPQFVIREAHALNLRTGKDNFKSLVATQCAQGVIFVSDEYRLGYPLPLRSFWRRLHTDVVPNATAVVPAERRPLNTGPCLRVGMAGRLVPGKRVDLLLDAAKLLSEWGTPISVSIAGDGPLRGALESRLQEIDPHQAIRVEFLGSLDGDNMRNFYRKLDMYVHLSDGEGESNAILEAAASALPILTSDSPGAESLKADLTSLQLTENSAHSVASSIVRLSSDPARLTELGAGNLKAVEEHRSMKSAVERYLEFFAQLDPEGPWLGALSRSRADATDCHEGR